MRSVKKMLVLILAFIMVLSLVGCGSKKSKSYADDDFLKSMTKGLEKRWEKVDSDETKNIELGSEQQQEEYKKAVDLELNEIKGYKDKKFKDSNLQELAIKYINQLKTSKSALKYVTVDYDKYAKIWDGVYNERAKIIAEIDNKYELKVSDKYKNDLKNMKTESESILDKEDLENSVSEMIKSVKLKTISSDDLFSEYAVILENKTDTKFTTFELSIKLKDKDGVIVDTMYDSTSNWEPKTKVKFSFTTDQKFKSYEIVPSYTTE